MVPDMIDESTNELLEWCSFDLALVLIRDARKLTKGQEPISSILRSLSNWICNRQELEIRINKVLKLAEGGDHLPVYPIYDSKGV